MSEAPNKAKVNGEGPAVVQLHVNEGIAHVTLARPERANAIDHTLARDLRAAVSEIHDRPDIRAVLLTGMGEKFCVGGDLKDFATEGGNAPKYVRGIIEDLHAAIMLLTSAPAPVVAAVQGAAAGAGLGLALAADIVIAASDARFVMAYTKAGVTPDGGTSWILPRLVGLHRALDLTLRNRVLTAAEAHALGLVAEVCKPKALETRANAIAVELANGPTAAFAEAKRLLRQSFHNDLSAQLHAEGEAVVGAFVTPDGQEGARAFSERREPVFRGPARTIRN